MCLSSLGPTDKGRCLMLGSGVFGSIGDRVRRSA